MAFSDIVASFFGESVGMTGRALGFEK